MKLFNIFLRSPETWSDMNEVHSPTVVFSLNWAARMEGGDLTRHGYEQFDLEAYTTYIYKN